MLWWSYQANLDFRWTGQKAYPEKLWNWKCTRALSTITIGKSKLITYCHWWKLKKVMDSWCSLRLQKPNNINRNLTLSNKTQIKILTYAGLVYLGFEQPAWLNLYINYCKIGSDRPLWFLLHLLFCSLSTLLSHTVPLKCKLPLYCYARRVLLL